jgi:hypothetical protein
MVYIKRKNIALSDAVHRLHQGILCFHIVVRFHGTRVIVILFTPIRELQPSLRRFARNAPSLNSIMCRTLVPNFAHNGQ